MAKIIGLTIQSNISQLENYHLIFPILLIKILLKKIVTYLNFSFVVSYVLLLVVDYIDHFYVSAFYLTSEDIIIQMYVLYLYEQTILVVNDH